MADDDDVLALEALPVGKVVPRGSLVQVYEEREVLPGPLLDGAEVVRSLGRAYTVTHIEARFLPERSWGCLLQAETDGRAWYGFLLLFELLADMRAPGRRPRAAASSGLRLLHA